MTFTTIELAIIITLLCVAHMITAYRLRKVENWAEKFSKDVNKELEDNE